jgi:hypothetical protein
MKKTLLASSVVAASSMLTGCGGGGGDSPSNPTSSSTSSIYSILGSWQSPTASASILPTYTKSERLYAEAEGSMEYSTVIKTYVNGLDSCSCSLKFVGDEFNGTLGLNNCHTQAANPTSIAACSALNGLGSYKRIATKTGELSLTFPNASASYNFVVGSSNYLISSSNSNSSILNGWESLTETSSILPTFSQADRNLASGGNFLKYYANGDLCRCTLSFIGSNSSGSVVRDNCVIDSVSSIRSTNCNALNNTGSYTASDVFLKINYSTAESIDYVPSFIREQN